MVDVVAWAWVGTGTWPGFVSTANQDPFTAANNGLTLDPAGYGTIIYRDANNNGSISDSDTDDGSGAGQDRIVVNGVVKTVHDVAVFNNSTMVINGVTYTVPITVWVFTDGTYITRISDVNIPAGVNHTAVSAISLGTWSGVEGTGTVNASRDAAFVCFASGTLILTKSGERDIATLKPGDQVFTLDHGFQTVRWAGRSTVNAQSDLAPIRIAAGALGNSRDLWVSPDHRMLVGSWHAELMFGESEVLVAAKYLVNGRTIHADPRPTITYNHILFDNHEIVIAEGSKSESFHPGQVGMGRLPEASRQEILVLFPTILEEAAAARRILKKHEARMLETASLDMKIAS